MYVFSETLFAATIAVVVFVFVVVGVGVGVGGIKCRFDSCVREHMCEANFLSLFPIDESMFAAALSSYT